ncbi:MAG TPA: hypothetical protein VG605_24320, partial [Puia sp.]|nr:hypothetical protein [Puia sp.]
MNKQMLKRINIILSIGLLAAAGCSKKSDRGNSSPPPAPAFDLSTATIDNKAASSIQYDVSTTPVIRLT